MRKFSIYSMFFLFAIILLPCSGANADVSELKAFYRSGQTFLTWKETGADWYYVYSSDKPITAVNGKDWIAKIPKGSSHFRFSQSKGAEGKKAKFLPFVKGKKWSGQIQIENDPTTSKCLPKDTGLFVRTVKKAAKTYYAVVDKESGAKVNQGSNSLEAAIEESVALPGANLVFKDKKQHFFVFFTDFEVWNKDRIDDHMHGYAHVFMAMIPEVIAKPAPLSVKLHAYSAWKDVYMKYSYPIKDGVTIAMFDYSLTWWFGHHEDLKSVPKKFAPDKGTVVNYTEQRLLQAVRWVASSPPDFPAKIDSNRVFVFGGSMGGSGTNHITVKNGDVFASGHGSKGYTNWSLLHKKDPKLNVWQGDFEKKYGKIATNLETNLDGKRVFDLLNLTKTVSDPRIEMGYLETANGSGDGVIPFWGLAHFWKALEKGKHPYSSGWDTVGHAGRLGSGSPMTVYKICKNEPLPAFANASCNSALEFGYRFIAEATKIDKSSVVVKTPLIEDVTGMTLLLAPSITNNTWFKIKSVSGNTITIENGDLLAFTPELTKYQIKKLKKALGRAPNKEEMKKEADKNKSKVMIIDGDPRGTRNGHIAWSSRLMNFDPKSGADDYIDSASKFAMNFRLMKNSIVGEAKTDFATVDITPRRCENFKPKPGQVVLWENWDHSSKSPKKTASGEVKADEFGLVTIPAFKVGKKGNGNRLVLSL